MKKVLIFIIGLVLFSCSKSEDDPAPGNDIEIPSVIDQIIQENGISPSEKDKINYIQVIDSVGYKIAVGRKNNNAWFAKFNQSGKEVYSTEINENFGMKYSHFNRNSFIVFNENSLFLMGWSANVDLTSSDNIFYKDYITFLATVDFSNGKYKITKNETGVSFKTDNFNDDYVLGTYVDNKLTHIARITINGDIAWEREAVNSESSYWQRDKEGSPLALYDDFTYIKSDIIAYITKLASGEDRNVTPIRTDMIDYCGIVDLREARLIFGFNNETVPLLMSGDGMGIVFFITKMYCDGDALYMEYKKCKEDTVNDPITNQFISYSYTDIARYRYKLSIDDYRILEHKEL